jgi:hypothetical protein
MELNKEKFKSLDHAILNTVNTRKVKKAKLTEKIKLRKKLLKKKTKS